MSKSEDEVINAMVVAWCEDLTTDDHPEEDVLSEYALGKLETCKEDEILAHASRCTQCAQILSALGDLRQVVGEPAPVVDQAQIAREWRSFEERAFSARHVVRQRETQWLWGLFGSLRPVLLPLLTATFGFWLGFLFDRTGNPQPARAGFAIIDLYDRNDISRGYGEDVAIPADVDCVLILNPPGEIDITATYQLVLLAADGQILSTLQAQPTASGNLTLDPGRAMLEKVSEVRLNNLNGITEIAVFDLRKSNTPNL